MDTERLASEPTGSTGDLRSMGDLHVVGIGASAGGLEALERFFANVSAGSGMAYVVVQHLSPDFKSLMEELLRRHTGLPIHLVEDGMPVEADHVYLIPPKKEMIIADGRLLLSERERTHELTLPIDTFFRSLAQDCERRAIAVVLSGAGGDGSRGIRDVHEAGGLVVAQDEETAQFDGMPRAARDAGIVDLVLSPEDMPAAILEHAQKERGASRPIEADEIPHGLGPVYQLLEKELGIDFTHYKPSTVTRRIERRLQMVRAHDVSDYVERLKKGHGELDVLYRDLLIGVTRFFRNEEAFEILEHDVLPELLRKGSKDTPFRVWVAGCATGEEAYSLAILLSDLREETGGRPIKIFATDVHPGSIEQAARGSYTEEAVANVGPRRLERYFVQRGGAYQLTPDIRQMVVFAQHNVITDAPFTRMDLVSCRNMLIYLQPAAQQRVLSLFHFALNRGGILFLGPSESPGALLDDFEAVDRHWRIYRKFRDLRPASDPRTPRARDAVRHSPAGTSATPPRHSIAGLLSTYDALLDQALPPSLLVNDRGELVHAFAGASKFLVPRDGRQDLDVIDNVHADLRTVLLGGLTRVKKDGQPIVLKGVRLSETSVAGTYHVSIRPVKGRRETAGHLLVTLEAVDAPAPTAPTAAEIDLDEASRDRLHALENELRYTKENLQAAVEQLETSNEELQATNEELLASNEELQSTNEELQSVNEELYTVNAEYQRKIGELTELTNDIDNLLASTDVGAVFLDGNLRIRKYTPQIVESFALLPQDVGRSIETFTHRLDHPELNADLRRVLVTGVPIERELRVPRGGTYFLRILPYRANGAIAGVVMTLIDVSGLRAAEDALFHERYLLNSLLSTIPDAIYFKDARGRFIRVNEPMAQRLGLGDPRDAEGKTAFELPDQSTALSLHRADEVVLATGRTQAYQLEQRNRADVKGAWDLVTRLPLLDRSRETVGVIAVFRDVTAEKRTDERIREGMRRRDEFLAMLSHELRNPLNALVSATSLLGSETITPERRTDVLRVIDRQTQQMARLLDDLLEVARVTQNKIELRRATIDLRRVLTDAADAVRGLLERRGIRFQVTLADEPLWVDGDPARLQQVHVNLLTNAAKYTQQGGSVALTARRLEGEVVVSVLDDGMGIAPDMIEPIFDLFVQSARTLDRSDGGLGVGLTLVRSLVAMHGGNVAVRSDGVGKGSEFVVRLPLSGASASTALPELGTTAATPPQSNTTGPGGKRGRIVIVEDNTDSRELLCELLSIAGFHCESAGRGDEGLALIERLQPDVALVDVGLPGLDGYGVARAVRAQSELSRVYLVALTGYGQPEDRARALSAGFDAFLVKPIDPERLMAVLTSEDALGRIAATAN